MHKLPRAGFWVVLVAWSGLTGGAPLSAAEPEVDFNRDVRSVFSNICFECHGPDVNQRQTDWRLDTEEGAFAELDSGGFAIVPGKSAESRLYQRISSKDPDEQMPPPGQPFAAAETVSYQWIFPVSLAVSILCGCAASGLNQRFPPRERTVR